MAVATLSCGTMLGVFAGAALADADPPSRVGRLTNLEGTVSFHTADQTSWGSAMPQFRLAAMP
jgi:hypothetical protein